MLYLLILYHETSRAAMLVITSGFDNDNIISHINKM